MTLDTTADNDQHLLSCINWIAAFHAGFIHQILFWGWPKGLWEKGTYWHLDTRQKNGWRWKKVS